MDKSLIPQIDAPVPELKALTAAGESFSLHQSLEIGSNIAMVFFRGHW